MDILEEMSSYFEEFDFDMKIVDRHNREHKILVTGVSERAGCEEWRLNRITGIEPLETLLTVGTVEFEELTWEDDDVMSDIKNEAENYARKIEGR